MKMLLDAQQLLELLAGMQLQKPGEWSAAAC
jgi:hypothetical protein